MTPSSASVFKTSQTVSRCKSTGMMWKRGWYTRWNERIDGSPTHARRRPAGNDLRQASRGRAAMQLFDRRRPGHEGSHCDRPRRQVERILDLLGRYKLKVRAII